MFAVVQNQKTTIATSLVLIAMCMSFDFAQDAQASAPNGAREDYFGRSTNSGSTPTLHVRINKNSAATRSVDPGPNPIVNRNSSPEQWFEAMDTYIGYYRPSASDKFVINQPFGQEVERVTKFCKIASKIAKNRRVLAHKLKMLPIPASMPSARELLEMQIAWYTDAAELYEDMVKPRAAARTKEELAEMLKDIDERSKALNQSARDLQGFENDLRRKFGVHPPRYDDALHEYTSRDRPN